MISGRGVVPACQSLDCVSVFALTTPDAIAVFDAARAYDPTDPYSRTLEPVARILRRRVSLRDPGPAGVLRRRARQDAPSTNAVAQPARASAGWLSKVDFALFLETASLLYDGPWVAERMAAIRSFFERMQTRSTRSCARSSAARRELLRHRSVPGHDALARAAKGGRTACGTPSDVLVVPTAPTAYKIDEVLADPFQTNRRLGHYTNFVNLLDLAAIAVPASFRPDGLPVGITLIGPAGSDRMLADLAQRFHQRTGLQARRSGRAICRRPRQSRRARTASRWPWSARI
mgnify:CR=1 FL=1